MLTHMPFFVMFQRKHLESYRTLRAICGNRKFNSVYFHFFYILRGFSIISVIK
mgnify:CR=1 FL=1